MASTVSVTIEGAHGLYTCTSDVLDMMIERHLPASPEELRRIVEDRTTGTWSATGPWSDVHEVSIFLIVLGDFEMGHIANGGS